MIPLLLGIGIGYLAFTDHGRSLGNKVFDNGKKQMNNVMQRFNKNDNSAKDDKTKPESASSSSITGY